MALIPYICNKNKRGRNLKIFVRSESRLRTLTETGSFEKKAKRLRPCAGRTRETGRFLSHFVSASRPRRHRPRREFHFLRSCSVSLFAGRRPKFGEHMNAIWRRSISHLSGARQLPECESKVLAFCRQRRLREAMQALRSCDPGLVASAVYSSVLQLCVDHGAEREGRSLHEYLTRHGCPSDMYLDTKFIIFYGRVGEVDLARELFDTMVKRSVVSWTAMISACSQNGRAEEAFEVFASMRQSGFKANQFTYGSVLRACTNMLCMGRGGQIHGCIAKSRFSKNLHVQSALVDLHSKCGLIEDAWSLFVEMDQKDVISWNSMIGGYVVQGLGDAALALFYSMLKDGFHPDHFTFASVLRACGGVQSQVKVNQIHGIIVRLGFEDHVIVSGSLIDAYAKCRNMSKARLLYDSMPVKDLVSCTALITGYSQDQKYSKDALEVFFLVNRMGLKIDGVIICSILNACANISSLAMGRQIHACMFKKLSDYDVAVGNALIDMYAKSGELNDARHIFDDMHSRNVITWTSMTTAYGRHGCGEDAVALFEKMKCHGLKPNDITFLSILSACSHAGLTEKGWQLFNSMIMEYKIKPRPEHYACYVDLLARGGWLEEAYDFMCKGHVKHNASLWGALLGACGMHGNVYLGKLAAGSLSNLEPRNSVSYVVLSNIYASAGLWEDAWKTRREMDERHIKKYPGYSLVHFMKTRHPLLLQSNETSKVV
ncbi:hypothetical protein Taro_008470 [Colocasia esculenta]|uniref:Pentatricopeptide repeat-containing protein n=1 Tax=Colocasia esculenta TaxID=4460 RepID=A0A843U176_COLES|nr:hypothetical protein [Colocasia esculenta]